MSTDTISRYKEVSQNIAKLRNFEVLADLYDPEVIYVDPASHIEGLAYLQDYLEEIAKEILELEIEWLDDLVMQAELGPQVVLRWQMRYSHKQLKHKGMITVEGMTFLKLRNGKIFYQQDYFDLGAMLYEQLPLLGKVITWLKKKIFHSMGA